MKRSFYLFFAMLFVLSSIFPSNAQTFQRTFRITAPPIGGFGNMVVGKDLDGDGHLEIYAVNEDINDSSPAELIPRIWKYVFNGTKWDSVWGCTMSDIPMQNSWPALSYGDLDGDGRKEIIWAPVNSLDATLNPNPARILVFEAAGDGSKNMGVPDGFGGWLPNAKTSITTNAMTEIRPFRLLVQDVDGDGKDEIIFCDRASGTTYHYGILGVDKIPNNGDGSETWTLKGSGLNDPILAGTGSKYDLAILNNIIYLFNNDGRIYPIKKIGSTWTTLTPQVGLGGAASSFKSAQTLDINGDGTKEIVAAEWVVNSPDTTAVYVYKQQGDTLAAFKIASFRDLGGYRLNASGFGDVDNNGKMDMIFGSRYDANQKVNNPIFRLEYQGGDITSPTSYTKSMIDSLYLGTGDDIDMIAVANLDGDPADEVIYSSGYTRGQANDSTMDIVILDTHYTPLDVKADHNNIPDNYYMSQNFPNPFNPTTSIKFGIPKESNVDLVIYNVLGEKVRTLISNGFMRAGTYTMDFNAAGLASGTYIYKLTTNNGYSVSKKMVLLK